MEELARWRRAHKSPLRLLDVGCGTGSFARMMARTDEFVSVVGLDYSPSMCKEADAKRGSRGSDGGFDLHFVAGDSEHLPFEDQQFDVVTCANSFHHYPHQLNVIREMKRVLRTGGRLMLLDGFRDNAIGWFVFDVVIGSIEKQVHHAPWSDIRGYFTEAGFANITQRKTNVLFPAVCTMGDA
ncbi:MAG: class I SAM-dependent methyltransferase [Phycisphaerae bacterium]